MMTSRYAHAKQFKRHHRQLRLLRSRLGRIIRDIRRKITGRPELEAVFEAPIARAAQIRSQQQRQRGWKLYSFHAPRSNASSMKGCGSPGCRRAEVRSGYGHVRFSNRPFEVKHFQTIRRCSVDVAHGLVLLFGIGTRPFHHGIRG